MIKKIIFLFIFLLPLESFAINEIEAKEKGLIGEVNNGYLGIIIFSKEVFELVNEINSQRRKLYLDLAKKNNLPLNKIEEIAGGMLIRKVRPGEYYKFENIWTKK